MHDITLVLSAHRENGLCSTGELLRILLDIGPEVVFEEIRPSDVGTDYQRKTVGILESHAIARYLKFKALLRVPVDTYEASGHSMAELKRDCDCVFAFVEQSSREYQILNDENDENVRLLGFEYLNSIACSRTMIRISEIEEKTIEGSGDPALIRGLARWRHFVLERDRGMVGTIYEYCRRNAFDTGVFLVGAAHRIGIANEIEQYAGAEPELISWRYYS